MLALEYNIQNMAFDVEKYESNFGVQYLAMSILYLSWLMSEAPKHHYSEIGHLVSLATRLNI